MVISAGCATLTDRKWADERSKYKEQCQVFSSEFGRAIDQEKNRGAESVADAINSVCLNSPKKCAAPKKSEDLLFYEDMGKPYTQDFCLDYIN